jgi:hypothetical protein
MVENINHEVRKIQEEIWNCVRLGIIPEVEAVPLSRSLQKYKVIG